MIEIIIGIIFIVILFIGAYFLEEYFSYKIYLDLYNDTRIIKKEKRKEARLKKKEEKKLKKEREEKDPDLLALLDEFIKLINAKNEKFSSFDKNMGYSSFFILESIEREFKDFWNNFVTIYCSVEKQKALAIEYKEIFSAINKIIYSDYFKYIQNDNTDTSKKNYKAFKELLKKVKTMIIDDHNKLESYLHNIEKEMMNKNSKIIDDLEILLKEKTVSDENTKLSSSDFTLEDFKRKDRK